MDETSLLVARAKKNDIHAFETLVHIHQNMVYSICMKLTGNHDDAQDLAQEAFIRAYRGLGSFRSEAEFGTWLHRITINVCLNALRKNGGRQQVSLDEPYHGEDGTEMRHEVASEDGDPLRALEEKEFNNLVQAAIKSLSDEHRTVLILREIEGFSYEEISSMIGCSLGTVKSRLSRAREVMRRKMTELARDAGEDLPAS
ncbi:MAG: ECF RNA polymerase sigma factor SigW [Pelotomaculum sp. PtaB.Bin104]|nr:MAG: ECF RNA polymerase sigma factor SigW [Pelotomaculum sp. PtaB.Bin104]